MKGAGVFVGLMVVSFVALIVSVYELLWADWHWYVIIPIEIAAIPAVLMMAGAFISPFIKR